MKKTAEMQTKIIGKIIARIKSARNILLSSHVGPDGDSLGSQIAFYYYLKALGKNAVIYNQGHIPHYYHSFQDIELVQVEPENWRVPSGGFDLAIIFECTAADRIGDVARLIAPGTDLINIDHHLENSEYGSINYLDPKASSVGEMNYRIFRQGKFNVTREMALHLYVAILTDTGRFHFASTSPEALRICADLLETGIDVKKITDAIYFSFTADQLRFMCEIVTRMELLLDGRVCFLTLSSRELEERKLKFGDMEGLVEWTMRMNHVQVGALLKEIRPDFTKISLRSQGLVDVCLLAQKFGGGGHFNASGGQLEADLGTTRRKLLETIEELLENGK